jgi:hypothetical protein
VTGIDTAHLETQFQQWKKYTKIGSILGILAIFIFLAISRI